MLGLLSVSYTGTTDHAVLRCGKRECLFEGPASERFGAASQGSRKLLLSPHLYCLRTSAVHLLFRPGECRHTLGRDAPGGQHL